MKAGAVAAAVGVGIGILALLALTGKSSSANSGQPKIGEKWRLDFRVTTTPPVPALTLETTQRMANNLAQGFASAAVVDAVNVTGPGRFTADMTFTSDPGVFPTGVDMGGMALRVVAVKRLQEASQLPEQSVPRVTKDDPMIAHCEVTLGGDYDSTDNSCLLPSGDRVNAAWLYQGRIEGYPGGEPVNKL